jgi:glycine oxidase
LPSIAFGSIKRPMSRDLDCIVVGAGVIGLAAALRLADAGLAVAIVDRGPPGREASWAAGGILAPQVEAHGPGPLFELLRASRCVWPDFARELGARGGVDVGYRSDGTLLLAGDDEEAEKLQERLGWQRAAGLPLEILSARELAKLEPALGRAEMGARLPDDHQVESRQVVAALVAACSAAGVELVRAEVRRVCYQQARVAGVELEGGMMRAATHVVVAAGAWSAQLDGVPLPAGAVVPVRGQMIELRTAKPILRHVVFGAGGYLVPRADGRMLCGSTEERVGFDKQVTDDAMALLYARAARLCPTLATAPRTGRWAGLRPASADALPYVGTTAVAGLHLATGHHRNGMLLAPLTAAIVAALVTGGAVPVDVTALSPSRA